MLRILKKPKFKKFCKIVGLLFGIFLLFSLLSGRDSEC